MLTKLAAALITVMLSACADNGPFTAPSSGHPQGICQGLGCNTPRNSKPSASGTPTRKATRDEKIRARRGEDPQFGQQDITIRGPAIRW